MLPLPDPLDTEYLNTLLAPKRTIPSERRRFGRRSLVCQAQLVPLVLNKPDFSRAQDVETVDISESGVSFLADKPPLGPHWAILLPTGRTPLAMEVTFRDFSRIADQRFRVACQFIRRISVTA